MSAAAPLMTGMLMTSETSRAGRVPPGRQAPGNCKPGARSEGSEIFRLASGIFYEPSRLGRAVGDLLVGGFRQREMCLAGTREALGSAKPVPVPTRQLRPLYPLAPNVEVVATSGVLLRKLLKEAAWREGESNLAYAWLLPELFGRFTDHIRRNAVVLLVSAPDSALQKQGSRILLRHSAHTVQTYQFSLSRPSGF